jgi:hypothetical protein
VVKDDKHPHIQKKKKDIMKFIGHWLCCALEVDMLMPIVRQLTGPW